MRTALGRFGTLADWPDFRRRAERSRRPTPTWPTAAATAAAASRVYAAGEQGADRARPAPAALPEPRLQPAERRHRALVRADHAEIGDGASLRTILEYCRACSGRLAPDDRRAGTSRSTSSASRRGAGEQGKPTPEGMHRDGVDYVLVLLVDRRNIAQRHHDDPRPRQAHAGQLHADRSARRRAGRRCALLPRRDAGRAGRTSAQPAYRDVLVVTFRKKT